MATQGNVRFWRLYLYLHEGVSFLSRYILSREVQKHNKDLHSLLVENEKQLKGKKNLDKAEIGVLFPDDGKSDIHKWDANLYLTVIQTLFRTSLIQKERNEIRNVQCVHKELCEDDDLDDQLYEDQLKRLQDAFEVLAYDEHSMMKIRRMRKIYIDEPLQPSSLLYRVKELNYLPIDVTQQLATFLEAISSTNTRNEVLEEGSGQLSGMNLNFVIIKVI